MKQKRQYAALPFRVAEDTVEVLLLTSRGTGRWILPKGWPKKRMAPHKLAMLEAFEEAGVKGTIAKRAIGHFHYVKRMERRPDVQCRVAVFPMHVKMVLAQWPEMDERQRSWISLTQAAGMVEEAELSTILESFSPPH
ncbi:hypothetical protein D1F64_08730 [Breoghania sp. L-A4]|nr:hypothetical protein D1F64_08730 [Breoghania sp. L-A4]